jgi:peptidoglycan/xylan/chitin deacetylase (PgdA/CDA1 family)
MSKVFHFTVDCDWIPGSQTALPGLFDLIESFNLRPTFFLTGSFAREYHEYVEEIVRRGYETGCHGLNHGLDSYENFGCKADLELRRNLLAEATGVVEKYSSQPPRLFRAPRLCMAESTFPVLSDLGYSIDSSIPARRYDLGFGSVNNPINLFRSGSMTYVNGTILEIPPTALVVPLNMRMLRTVGQAFFIMIANTLFTITDTVVFYLHPAEFVLPSDMSLPRRNESFFRTCRPGNFRLLEAFIHALEGKNIRYEYMSKHLDHGS